MARRPKLRIVWAIPLALLAGSVRLDQQPPAPDAREVIVQPAPAPAPAEPARAPLVSERSRHREEMEQRVENPVSRDEARTHRVMEKEG